MSVSAPAVKKFVNDPEDVVPEALAGIAAAHPGPGAGRLRAPARSSAPTRPSRARSGSSRAAARATSRCTAASSAPACSTRPAPGAVFTSPVPDQMSAATRAVNGGAGVVHIVKNYTGDVLNFRMAAELVGGRRHRGRERSSWTTTAPSRTRCTRPGAAAPARPCWPRRSPARAPRPAARWPRSPTSATRVNDQARSFGVALTSCATPGKGTPDLRARRRRDRGRRRHPRRARPPAREAHHRRTRSPR